MNNSPSSVFVETFGTKAPLIQGPMSGTSGPALVAAVANAGGLGMLPVWGRSVADAQSMIAETRALTDGPFGVNLRSDFKQLDHIAMAAGSGAPIIHLFWGDPGPSAAAVRAANATLIVTVDDADAAKAALDAGAAALIAQGVEAGGHVLSETPRDELLSTVLDLAGAVPVIAAGGLSTSGDVARVVAAGAAGALCGTRFVASDEADAHDAYKQALINAGANATVRTKVFDIGWPDAPLRALRNSTYDMWEAAGCPESGQRPGEGDIVMTFSNGEGLPRYHAMAPKRGMSGEFEAAVMYAGTGVESVRDIRPAADIVAELASAIEL